MPVRLHFIDGCQVEFPEVTSVRHIEAAWLLMGVDPANDTPVVHAAFPANIVVAVEYAAGDGRVHPTCEPTVTTHE